MTTDKVRRRIQTNSSNVADGLERLQADILELFNSQLDKYRLDMLGRDEATTSMLKSLVEEIGALKRGITGLSQQLSEYESILPPNERRKAVAQLADHEARITELERGDGDVQ